MSNTFSHVDWVFVVGFLLVTIAIGVLARRRVANLDDFLLAGRSLRSVWGIATLASTEMGLVTIVYFSEEAYSNGFVAISTGVIAAGTMWLIGQTGFVIKRLRGLNLKTVPEYFEQRYSPQIRWIAGTLTFVTGALNIGIFLQVEGRFLVIAMGLPEWSLPVLMGILLLFVVAYTLLGGMVSVVLTDLFQFVWIAIGIVLTSYFAFGDAGGAAGMASAVREQFGDAGFRLWEAPKYGLLFLIWTALYYTSGWSSWQPVVQRTLSMQDVSTALRLFRISSLFMFLRACLPMLWGIAALAILGVMNDSQAALPVMLLSVIPAGLLGFILVGFLAASMSTYDSYLLSFSAILVQDIWAPLTAKPMDDQQRMRATRIAIVVLALFVYAWGVWFSFTDTVFRVIALTGSISYAGLISGLVGGMYWKRASTFGAYCAFIAGALPPVTALAIPEVSTTGAGLLSFVLAPAGLVLGSLWGTKEGAEE